MKAKTPNEGGKCAEKVRQGGRLGGGLIEYILYYPMIIRGAFWDGWLIQ
jgi:hypothetical protein